jgi:hypothetical protein
MSDRTGTRFDAPLEIVQGGSPAAGPSRARRRLLLGAAAALPSVYTLTSGAQTAAASVLHCTVANPPSNLQRFTQSDDNWFRNKVYVGRWGNDKAYCVTAYQSACVNPLHPDQAGQGSTWIVNNVRRTAGNTDIYHIGSAPDINRIASEPQAYGLVYVDAKGTIRTLDPNGNLSLQPVTGSCMASMIGGEKSLLG